MNSIFLTYIYPIMRIIALTVMLSSCGSIQTINGVRIKQQPKNVKTYSIICISSFGVLVYGMYNVKAVN